MTPLLSVWPELLLNRQSSKFLIYIHPKRNVWPKQLLRVNDRPSFFDSFLTNTAAG